MSALETESREDSSKKLVDFLRRTDAPAFFQNVLAGNEKIPAFDQFKDYLIRINGIARKIPIATRRADGENVQLGGLGTVNLPRHEDKEMLLKYAYDALPHINRDDAKYVLPAVVNATHLFADGNGRTSRALHLLLREFPSMDERLQELRKALGDSGRFDSYDINPGRIEGEIEHVVLADHGWEFDETGQPKRIGPIEYGIATAEFNQLDTNDPMQKMAKDFVRLYGDDAAYACTALYERLGDEGVEHVSEEYGDVKRMSPLKMATGNTALSAEEWQAVYDNFYQLKKEHVETLINLFAEPEKYKTPDDTETIRERFIKKIEQR